MNRNCALRDPRTGVSLDVSRDLRTSDLLDDHSMVDDHRDAPVGRHNYVLGDRNDLMMGVNSGVSHGLRMSDPLDDHSMDDDHRDVLVGHHMNVTGDRRTDGNRVSHNCARLDLNRGANLDAMNRHVK